MKNKCMAYSNYIFSTFVLCLFSFQVQALPPHVKTGISSNQLQNVRTISQGVLKARDTMDKIQVPLELKANIKQLRRSLPVRAHSVNKKKLSKAVRGKRKGEALQLVAQTTPAINDTQIRNVVKKLRKYRQLEQSGISKHKERKHRKVMEAALRKIKKIEQEVETALTLEPDAQFARLSYLKNRLNQPSYVYDSATQTPTLISNIRIPNQDSKSTDNTSTTK